jgi:uncharacterized protein YndB with AHSA1/START domain
MTDPFAVFTPTGDTASLHLVREYPTDVADLWNAVSTPERVSRWFARVEGDFALGQEFTLHFDDGTAQFEVLTCEPPERAQVAWKRADGASTVTVQVSANGNGSSRLVLEHTGLPIADAPQYGTGWHWHLATLRAHLADTERDAVTWDELAAHYRDALTPA